MLRGEPASRRPNEGATRRDDRTLAKSHQGLVPEQKVQGQEEDDTHEAADAAREGWLMVIGLSLLESLDKTVSLIGNNA